jgi:hypothetical protein
MDLRNFDHSAPRDAGLARQIFPLSAGDHNSTPNGGHMAGVPRLAERPAGTRMRGSWCRIARCQRDRRYEITRDDKRCLSDLGGRGRCNVAKTGKQTPLTSDGQKDFGYATDNAGCRHSDRPVLNRSPGSSEIATYRQDQRNLGEMLALSSLYSRSHSAGFHSRASATVDRCASAMRRFAKRRFRSSAIISGRNAA